MWVWGTRQFNPWLVLGLLFILISVATPGRYCYSLAPSAPSYPYSGTAIAMFNLANETPESNLCAAVTTLVAKISVYCALASFITCFLTSRTYKVVTHWRTLLIFSASLAFTISFSITSYHEYGLVSYIYSAVLGYILLHSLFFGSYLFAIRQVEASPKEAKTIIATHSFTIPITLPTTGPHFVHQGQQTYAIPIQVWWQTTAAFAADKPAATMWTSGDPKTQDAELQVLLTSILKDIKLPTFLFQHLALFEHVSPRVVFAPECPECPRPSLDKSVQRRPVVIYSHGLFGWRQLASSAITRLVSEGYVVLSLDHSPTAYITRPPRGGKYLPFDFRLPPGFGGTEKEHEFYNSGLERRVLELQAVMDFVCGGAATLCARGLGRGEGDEGGAAAMLAELVDPQRLHLFGHSFGAATIASVCARDSRVKSAVLLDSWLFPMPAEDLAHGSRATILFLSSSNWNLGKAQISRRTQFVDATKQKGVRAFLIRVNATDHQNFCDIFQLCASPLLTGMIGPVDAYALMNSLNTVVAKFFARADDPDVALEKQRASQLLGASVGSELDEPLPHADPHKTHLRELIKFLSGDANATLGSQPSLLDELCVNDEEEKEAHDEDKLGESIV
jgi:pimeloyl-ACP methyl ester carboxylesterase